MNSIVNMSKSFHVVITQDPDGGYVGSVPELYGCHSQADTVDDLLVHMKEAVALCLESESENVLSYVGVREISVE